MDVPLPAPRQRASDALGRLRGRVRSPTHDARDKAQAARQQLANDIDPIDQRAAERQAQAVQQAHATTFSEAAKAYIEANESGWRSDKRATQWRNSLGQRKGTPMSDMT